MQSISLFFSHLLVQSTFCGFALVSKVLTTYSSCPGYWSCANTDIYEIWLATCCLWKPPFKRTLLAQRPSILLSSLWNRGNTWIFFVQKLLYPFNLLIVEFLLQKIDNPFLKKTLVYFLKCRPYVFIWQFKKSYRPPTWVLPGPKMWRKLTYLESVYLIWL